MLVGAHTKVLVRLPRSLHTTEKDGVGPGGGPQRKLIKGDNFTTSIEDALLRATGEAEGGDGELRNFHETDVVGDDADLDDDF